MIYQIHFTQRANKDIAELKKGDPAAYKKLTKLLIELMEHPYDGTGKPERMKHRYADFFSRRITQKHRLVYRIDDETVTILVLSTKGHYDDK